MPGKSELLRAGIVPDTLRKIKKKVGPSSLIVTKKTLYASFQLVTIESGPSSQYLPCPRFSSRSWTLLLKILSLFRVFFEVLYWWPDLETLKVVLTWGKESNITQG